ncbi:hypothetical protein PF004_g31591 [Phytophthora fragariae]|uniref:Uncharacterized protein n=1 Tax=Phytophthora fragariae TaxID=53985 RepID=A0A6G0M9L8_9STRA|nr:hypothetical protein PF004_g31591 [Phytophthora fragariae]
MHEKLIKPLVILNEIAQGESSQEDLPETPTTYVKDKNLRRCQWLLGSWLQ